MPTEQNSKMVLTDDLIVNNIQGIRHKLLAHLKVCTNIEIDLSRINKIDISGLQLLISLGRESKKLGKTHKISGDFTDSFSDDLNKVSFSTSLITDGLELNNYIKEMV